MNPPLIYVLLVEDDPTEAGRVLETLRGLGFQVRLTHVDRLTEALAVLAAGAPDVVLLDLGLPDSQGLDTLVKLHNAVPHVPAVVMTSAGDDELGVRAVRLGAQDYLDKCQLGAGALGRVIRYAVVRARSESALRESEERFRNAFEATHVPMVLTDLENRFVRANTAFALLFGYTPEEILTLSMADISHPDDRPESHSQQRALLAGAVPFFQTEKRYIDRNGRVLWGLVNVSLVRDARGRPVQYVGQIQDITERKRAEAERDELELRFHRAQQQLRFVLGSSPAVLFTLVVDRDAVRFTWISENVWEMLGFPEEEVLRPDWWTDRLHPDEVERGRAEVRELLVRGRRAHEFRLRHRDGKYRWVRGELRLVSGGAVGPAEVVGSWSEITERKQLEDQLRQAQKMEAVGQLAGGVAHDFNNLLTIINGYSEIILAQLPGDSPVCQLVREIGQAGELAASLTRQLLAFSRKQVLEPKVVNLNTIVADTERLLRRLIGADVNLSTVLEPALGTVKVDPGQIEQVMMNLAVNARDAMPQGGHLTLETANVQWSEEHAGTWPEAEPGHYVMLAVSDTGVGMGAEVQARLFEPFFTTKGPGRGTGLGLATVYGIVKQSAGFLSVYSEVGRGTTFKVYLPRAEGPPVTGKSFPGKRLTPGGAETVLLAEDEPGLRALIRHILEAQGYAVLEAGTGDAALRVAEVHPGTINLLVTDVVMPVMDGPELAKRIIHMRPGTKILYLSGYTDDAVVRHGVSHVDSAFLQKPFTPSALAQKVRETLDQSID
jgi:PAS domain S-box-containing protein